MLFSDFARLPRPIPQIHLELRHRGAFLQRAADLLQRVVGVGVAESPGGAHGGAGRRWQGETVDQDVRVDFQVDMAMNSNIQALLSNVSGVS